MGQRQQVTTSRDREARGVSPPPHDPWRPPALERLGEQFRELEAAESLEDASRPRTRFLKSLARRRELARRLIARAKPLPRRGPR
jgi:hypothetical protein